MTTSSVCSGEQQLVLRWHYQEVTLVRNLPCLLENDVLTDVTLSVGAHNVKAHKLVLAMCSVYFLQLFQEMTETQHPVIVLHNVTMEDMKAVLSFIYRGQCIVSKDQLPSLLSVAKLLKIQGLCDMKVPEKSFTQTAMNNNNINNNENDKPPEICSSPTDTEPLPSNDSMAYAERQPSPSPPPPKNSLYWAKSVPVFSDNPPRIKHHDPHHHHHQTLPPPPPLRKPPKDSSETCKCFLCGKYLSNQYNLRVHMETHEEAYHACQSCPHVSRSRDALRKHVSYRHPEEYHTRKRKKLD